MIYLSDTDWKSLSPYLLDSNEKVSLCENLYKIMKTISSKLKFSSQVVLSIAMIYFHKYFFYSKFDIEKGTKRLFLCASFIFIATKVANCKGNFTKKKFFFYKRRNKAKYNRK